MADRESLVNEFQLVTLVDRLAARPAAEIRFPIRRPDDHLVLDLLFDNLHVDMSQQPPRLTRADTGRRGVLIVEFPPQSFGEQAFQKVTLALDADADSERPVEKRDQRSAAKQRPAGPTEPVNGLGAAYARMSGPSRLAFTMPADVAGIPFTLEAVRLSMCLTKDDLQQRMGLWQWLDAAAQQALERDATEGSHWMFTPWQDVELVHAVQRPLLRPVIERLTTLRDGPSSTRAIPFFEAICSLKSTDKLALRAHWHEPDDDPARGLPADRSRDDLAFEVKITEARDYRPAKDALPDHTLPDPKDPDRIEINARHREWLAKKCHEFNDTRYRRIEYRLDARKKHDQLEGCEGPRMPPIARRSDGVQLGGKPSETASIKLTSDAK